MRAWMAAWKLHNRNSRASLKSDSTAAIHYALTRWDAFMRYCDDLSDEPGANRASIDRWRAELDQLIGRVDEPLANVAGTVFVVSAVKANCGIEINDRRELLCARAEQGIIQGERSAIVHRANEKTGIVYVHP